MRFCTVHRVLFEARKRQISPSEIRRLVNGPFAYVWVDTRGGRVIASRNLSHGRLVANNPQWFGIDPVSITPQDKDDNDFCLELTHSVMENDNGLVRIEVSGSASNFDMEAMDSETSRRALRLLIDKYGVDVSNITTLRVDVNTGYGYHYAKLSGEDIEEFAGYGPVKSTWFR